MIYSVYKNHEMKYFYTLSHYNEELEQDYESKKIEIDAGSLEEAMDQCFELSYHHKNFVNLYVGKSSESSRELYTFAKGFRL